MHSKTEQEIQYQTSEICKFYAGKTIFLTGAAGFLGSVLLESLLRCCPDIYRIYILLRPKKGVKAEERKKFIFEKDIFSKLNATNPDVLNKVVAISGDTSQENLGLCENDFNNLIKEVSIVFHVAATISFVKPLSFIIRQNVIGTNNVIDLCRQTEKLEALVYTSSAFSNCNQIDVIEEKIYDLPFSPEEVIKFGKYDDEDELIRLYEMCKPSFPNYYTFSKCVAENLLKDKASDLPVCIIRPSIIFSCLRGCLPGYLEEGSALVSLCEAVGKGVVRVIYLDRNKRLEIIPVDVVGNTHIVGASCQASKGLPSLSVINCVSGELSVIPWGVYIESMLKMARRCYVPQSFIYPITISCKNFMLYKFLFLLLHSMPAVIIDLFLWISGSKFRLMEIYKIYYKALRTVEFFTMRDWDMRNKNFQTLSKGLNSLEQEMFSMDLNEFTMDELTKILPKASCMYRLNGKIYEETAKWSYLRYFLTFIMVCFYIGIFATVLFLFSKIW